MERMFNKAERARQRKAGGSTSPSFASLTAGLMARKGEAVPAPAHLDGVSIHSHGVQREPQSVADRNLAATIREQLMHGKLGGGSPEGYNPEPTLMPEPTAERSQELASDPASEPDPNVEQFSAPQAPKAPEADAAPALFQPGAAPVHKARKAPREEPPHVEEPEEALPEEVLRSRATRRATTAMGDCCALPLPAAVTETLPPGPYAKVTTRLDRERVRQLKLLAARMETTNQKVMLAALDYYLDFARTVLAKECPCLSKSLNEDK